MIHPTIPLNEEDRLKDLESFDIIDTLPEEAYDSITNIASIICDTPIALVSFVDSKRQWFKSHHGIDATETPKELAFCAHAINNPDQLFIVNDALKDERFFDNPLTVHAPNVVFYAGTPLKTSEGIAIGTLCVIDNKPNKLNESQKAALKSLGKQVVSQLELRRNNSRLIKQNKRVEELNHKLNQFSYRLSHDLKTPLRGIQNISRFLKEDLPKPINQNINSFLDLLKNQTSYMNDILDGMLEYSKTINKNIKHEAFFIKDLICEIADKTIVDEKVNISFSGDYHEKISFNKYAFVSIFQNLISNSIKYSNTDNIEILIDFKTTKQECFLKYMDNGPGIPKSKRDIVFEIFETLGKKGPRSTGIGLSSVKSFIENSGGNIYLKNRPDGENGVCFEIKLPNYIHEKKIVFS